MSTFALKTDAKSEPMHERQFTDFTSYLYTCKPVRQNEGKIVVLTEPQDGGKHVLGPRLQNGFIGAIFQAYSEHRHLVLRPDDVWLAITTALGLYVNNHSEEMRHAFVDHEGKIELNVEDVGTLYTVDWGMMINKMSNLIEKNTKGDVRSWIEPTFSTTTPTMKTVGQVVLMGVMKNYFDYKMTLCCGLPKVTLEGEKKDWEELRKKASHLKSFNVDCLTHWAGLLDPILSQFVDSYSGKVDLDFWSHICHREGWGSGPRYLCGWVNVFIPFGDEDGEYKLLKAMPDQNDWCQINMNDVPPSTTEVPVLIDDNGREYATIFYGGHIVCVYDEAEDSLRPSLDWAMVDVTEFLNATKEKNEPVKSELERLRDRMGRFDPSNYRWQDFPKPVTFKYGIQ